jgi:hypothetical protein
MMIIKELRKSDDYINIKVIRAFSYSGKYGLGG